MLLNTEAAILVETGKPLIIDEVELPTLKSGQVLVKIDFSGVCHTQLLETRGYRGHDPYLPHLLGHEGSGTLMEVGPNVQKVRPGDKVILSWMQGYGANVAGSVYEWNGRKVNSGAITTFSRHAVVSENRVTQISAGCDMRQASLIGCAAATGIGVVWNTLGAGPGNSIAVFGCGGIGLCSINASRLAGCYPVIAIDVSDFKLNTAGKMGADIFINASVVDPVNAIKEYCQDGVDFAIESSGKTSVMLQAVKSVRAKSGIVGVVGNARHGEILELDPREFNQGKQIKGTWGGNNSPDIHFKKYLDLTAAGRLNLDPLLSADYPLTKINEALDDLENGSVVRPIINMSLA